MWTCLIVMVCFCLTHMYAVDIEGDIWDGDGVHFASELHLQHALKAPIHEGGMRDPWGHCGVNMHRVKHHKDHHLILATDNWSISSPSHMFSRLMTKPPVK